MSQVIRSVLFGNSLAKRDAEALMLSILEGEVSPELLAGFLVALRFRGENREEMIGFVRALRRHSTPVPTLGMDPIDTCGTGGDLTGTFNISTATALVIAGAGARVAKHGNRSASGKCGSADVLEALNVPIEISPEKAARNLENIGLCFLFAPLYHRALSRVRPVRTALGVPTVFNLLGPLINPAQVKRQIIGVSDLSLLPTFAEILREEGAKECLIVHGQADIGSGEKGGIDEISLSSATQIAHLKNGAIEYSEITPEDFGLPRSEHTELLGGSAFENAVIIERILGNEEMGPKRDSVLANSSAALVVAGIATDFRDGVRLARESIKSGRALDILAKLRRTA